MAESSTQEVFLGSYVIEEYCDHVAKRGYIGFLDVHEIKVVVERMDLGYILGATFYAVEVANGPVGRLFVVHMVQGKYIRAYAHRMI